MKSVTPPNSRRVNMLSELQVPLPLKACWYSRVSIHERKIREDWMGVN